MAGEPKASPTEMARTAHSRLDLLEKDIGSLQTEVEKYDPTSVRERLAVLEDRVHELKRIKDESEKRHWQFVYIFAGAMASLLVTVIVQLILAWVKKP